MPDPASSQPNGAPRTAASDGLEGAPSGSNGVPIPPSMQSAEADACGGLSAWCDQRTGWKKLAEELFEERVPGGARWSYVFGSGLLLVLISQAVTGVFLALYYVPSADHAHTTVAYITKVVASGSFIRGIHAYGASVMVILLVMHMTQTFMFGAYKGRRELLWLSGCILFALVLGMAFTGYLLPWDEKAYFATAVGTSAMSEVPFIGGWLNLAMRGGAGMGTLTISRFFVAHVFLIPGALLLFVALHLLLFRKAGPAGPPGIDLPGHQGKTDTFYPKQALIDAAFALLLIAVLAVLAHFLPKGLGPRVNPADTSFIPRPEWYYRPIFQWLKYWEGPLAVIGILVVPGIVAALLLGLPFYDRRRERRPWRRPIAAGIFSLVLLGLIALGFISYRVDDANPIVAAQLARQNQAEQDYMRQPFQPETAGGTAAAGAIAPVAAPAATVDPLIAQGKQVFTSQGCVVCHGEGGAGTPMATKLTGIGRKLSAQQMETLIRHPNAQMTGGGMPSFNALTGSQMKALIAYLESLK